MRIRGQGSNRGMFLLGMLLAVALMAVIVGMLIPYGAAYYERARLAEERELMKQLGSTIQQSFYATDSKQNLSFFSGASYMAAGSTLTTQTSSFAATTSFTLADATWQAKVGRMLGLNFTAGQVVAPNGGEVSKSVVWNWVGNNRWLLVGPANEAGVQRYLLLSLMMSPEAISGSGLTMPTNDGTAAYFNAIWDNVWDVSNAAPPSGWSTRLTTAQYNLWGAESRGRTYASRLIVIKYRDSIFSKSFNCKYCKWTN